MEIINEKDYKLNQWQGGITRELFIYPEGSSLKDRNFDLRISSAVIDQTESVFSDFSGYTRYIMLLNGDITLSLNNQQIMLQPRQLFKFSGSDDVTSQNSPGATDFNIIFRDSLGVEACVVSDTQLEAAQHLNIVFALEPVIIDQTPLPKHATALLSTACTLEGTAVVIRF